MKEYPCIVIFCLFALLGRPQETDLAIALAGKNIAVISVSGDTLKFPFAGGMNNCQAGSIDLNNDGILDLLVFDRHGNRIMPFINHGFADEISYVFSPEFVTRFPDIREWVQLHDYNGDQKKDIFTYTTGGIKVYRNDGGETLRFTQVSYPYLVSWQGGGYTNILVTYADYPAIADVDEDGDLDILTFWGLGSFVEWHRNTSMELYGIPDSLVFEKASDCWGRFAEAGESNLITLDTCVEFEGFHLLKNDPKHTGSTLLADDFNSDGLVDLVIGDVDFSTPVLLTNGGTPQEAAMVSQSVLFPNEGHPLSLVSFPAVCQVDVNNDGLNDLMASPFDPSLVRSESIHSSWLYLGSDNGELYKFEKDDFLQDEMIDVGSGAYPLLIDVDGDGLMDLLLGNFGALDSSWYTPSTGLQCQYIASLAYLRNVGDIDKPAFRMISTDFLGLSALEMQSLIPSAGDLDGDDDIDILCGNSKGKFVYIENKAGPGNPPEFVLADPAYRQLDIGDFSAPQIIDLDLDGLNDIVSGMRNGQLAFLRNTGPVENPQYVMVTDTLGGVDVTNASLSYFGYSVPFFFTKPDNSLMLLIASEFGEVFVYEDIEENILGDFTLAGQLSVPYQGWRTAVSAGYLDNDTLVDIFIGNYSGGLGCFGGIKTSGTGIGTSPEGKQGLMIYPNPASNRVYLDLSGGDMKNNVLIQVFQADGKLIRKYSPVSLPLIMDTSGFNAGLYFISINTGSYEVSGKLFIVP